MMPESKLHASEAGGGPEDVRHVLLAVGHRHNVAPQTVSPRAITAFLLRQNCLIPHAFLRRRSHQVTSDT